MIILALGSNLPLANQTAGTDVLRAALIALEDRGVKVRAKSRLYKSEPVPISDQDWYVNAAIWVETSLNPQRLLAVLHEIEASFGRQRTVRNAARELDLDIIDYEGRVEGDEGAAPILPHPRMHARSFVLLPIADFAPDWCHPGTGASLSTLLKNLGDGVGDGEGIEGHIEALEEVW